ncbi:MAG: glycosyltransferase family 2 protein [Chitinophagaceae bacterium]|nr:glycosyltransferase family 2 protein [Chitinophagaceae bacterium]
MGKPFISICIPAYKRVDYLKRLLLSIRQQTYSNFEVIITDDSDDESVEKLIKECNIKQTVSYCRNSPALGTPANWNLALSKAKGEWIKIMHDDDWFSENESLEYFAKAVLSHNDRFIFSGYINYYFTEEKKEIISPSYIRLSLIRRDPYSLLSQNIIGPPSVTLLKNDKHFYYDTNIKWLVDIDYYIQRLKQQKIFYIKKTLINVGIGDDQVTASCHLNPKIEIPEYLYFLEKTGVQHLKNILVYDTWWRLLRNFKINRLEDLEQYDQSKNTNFVNYILTDVIMIPKYFIRVGIFSKFFMLISYLKNRKYIR